MENKLEVVNIRLVKEPSLYSEQTLNSPQAVVELMAKELSQYDREVFCILNMKNNGQVINMNLVSVGTINASLVIPREVFKSSILANASAIIGLHNQCETVKRGYDCYEKAAEVWTAIGNRIAGSYHCRRN